MRRIGIFFTVCALLCALLTGCAAKPTAPIDIRINEVLTAGHDADWIELYNAGSEAVQLDGCFLSDDEETPGKWMFPQVTVEAGAYLIVYADKGESTAERLSLPFALKASGETLVFSDPNGKVLDKVTIPESTPGVSYGRSEGNAFAFYASPTPGRSNETGMILGQQSVNAAIGVCINEYMSRNRLTIYDRYGEYSDWIELRNLTDKAVDLSGFYLTDSRESIRKWQFPTGTTVPANGYLLVFCTGKPCVPDELHASFKLGETDSFLGLYAADGAFCSGLTYHATEQDESVGYRDGAYVPCLQPTPGYENRFVE